MSNLIKSRKSTQTDYIVSLSDAPFQYQESINSLRTNLHFLSMSGECKKIVITSAIPAEGKTSIAINLSYSLAAAGSNVLLIDCDLRKPVVHRYLKLPGGTSEGLTNTLRNQEKTGKVGKGSFHCIQPKFFVLTAGVLPTNPTTILGSILMGNFLNRVSELFNYVILDTAPVSVVTDAAVLSQHADGVLMVVRQKMATIEQARQAKKNLAAVNANILGVVLNAFDIRLLDKDSGYYYSYYHNYGKEDEKERVES